jgi:hypothetical protein
MFLLRQSCGRKRYKNRRKTVQEKEDERKIVSGRQHKATFEIWIIPLLHPKFGELL